MQLEGYAGEALRESVVYLVRDMFALLLHRAIAIGTYPHHDQSRQEREAEQDESVAK